MEGDQPALAMRVIVGDPEHQTPLFSDEMTYVVFSPYLEHPARHPAQRDTAARGERPGVSPAQQHRSGGHERRRRVLDPTAIDWSDEAATKGLRFRQRPGPENALGLVKFIFPNHFNVYLHDTPGDGLFSSENRAFSHGCIRVEQPVALAQVRAARSAGVDGSASAAAMGAGHEQAVMLKEKLPRAHRLLDRVGRAGRQTVTFTDDPYGIDPEHARCALI